MIDWNKNDRAMLADYLKRSQGKFLAYLTTKLPDEDALTLEGAALQAKERKGAASMISDISTAAEALPETPTPEEHIDPSLGIPA